MLQNLDAKQNFKNVTIDKVSEVLENDSTQMNQINFNRKLCYSNLSYYLKYRVRSLAQGHESGYLTLHFGQSQSGVEDLYNDH